MTEYMTQADRVLNHLRQRKTITQKEAIDKYGIYRLGARVYDLRHKGHDIRRDMVTEQNRYGELSRFARYYLVEKEED